VSEIIGMRTKRSSSRLVQSQLQQAQGSVPFSCRQFLRLWASLTLSNSKKLFSIRPFFGEGRGAKTGLNPMSNTVRTNAGTLEVVNVFVPGNRAASQRTISDGFQ
jgi:hypothetical protein